MSEQENDFATAWAPAKEPSHPREIEGRVTKIDPKERKRPKDGDTHYPILTLEDVTTPGWNEPCAAVHAFHSVLEREIKDNFTASEIIGSRIKIRYEGEKTTRDGENTYHLYKVFGGTRRQKTVVSVLNWDDEPATPVSSAQPPIAASQPFTGPGGIAPGVAPGPAILNTVPVEAGPLPAQPSVQERAAQGFGDEAPF